MSEPLVFSDTYGIKEGRAGDFLETAHRVVDLLQANSTRHLYFVFCMNDEGTAYSNVQIHPEAESMVAHMKLVAEHIQTAMDFLDFSAGDEHLYGTPSDTLLEQLAQWGTKINRPVGGFSRLGPSEQTGSVSEPLVVVQSFALEDGAAEDYKAALPEWFAWNEAEHPRLLHHKVYLSEEGTLATNVQVHPDLSSVEFQLQLISDRPAAWQKLIDESTMRLRIVGSPSDAVVNEMGSVAGSSVPLRVETPTVGFSRLPVA